MTSSDRSGILAIECASVARRDRLDTTREASPLVIAPDAHVLDTTGRSVEDVVEEVLSWL